MNLCQYNLFITRFRCSRTVYICPRYLLHLLVCYVSEGRILSLLQQLCGWKIGLTRLSFLNSKEIIYCRFLLMLTNNHHSSISNHKFLIYVLYISKYCYHPSILRLLLIYFYPLSQKPVNNHSRLNYLFVHCAHQCF